jgi:hypothetical protein
LLLKGIKAGVLYAMIKSKMKKLFAIIITSIIIVIGGGYLGFKAAIGKIRHDFYLKEVSIFRDPNLINEVSIFGDPNFIADLKSYQAKECYRFYWSRCFHHPVLITVIVNNNEQGILNLRVTSGAGGYEPGNLIVNKDIQLDKEGINKLREVVNSNKFWKEKIPWKIGLDGSIWTIEAKYESKYYTESQFSPKQGSIRNIGMYLIDISGLKPDPNIIY